MEKQKTKVILIYRMMIFYILPQRRYIEGLNLNAYFSDAFNQNRPYRTDGENMRLLKGERKNDNNFISDSLCSLRTMFCAYG
jgi:hypothetical protein